MKVLILLSGHRQHIGYQYWGILLKSCKNLSQYCDVFVHSNTISNNILDHVQWISVPKQIYITEKNSGFILGGLEAISDTIDMLRLYSSDCKYDLIIHLHPDVFICNEQPILSLLEQELNTDNVFLLLLMGIGKHKIKRKAEMTACFQALKILDENIM